MIKLISVGGIPNSPLDEYICDTDDDLFSLEPAPFGTIVFCAEDGKTYIAGSNGEFIEKPTGGSNSGSGGAGGVGDLPDTTSASAGDVLSLDEDKEPVWSTPSGGGGGMIITVAQAETDLPSLGEDAKGHLLDQDYSDIVDFIENGNFPLISYYPENEVNLYTVAMFSASFRTQNDMDFIVIVANVGTSGSYFSGTILEVNSNTYLIINK